MGAFTERVKQDIIKIEAFSKATGNRVRLQSTHGNPVNKIVVQLHYATAPSDAYPQKVQDATEVKIELLSRYPFQEPNATITTPIYHPNVYSSGKICFGTKWLPTEGLDLLVKRIIQIITFDPMILNVSSPANRQALNWWLSAVKKHPDAFPTDKLEIRESTAKPSIAWTNVSTTLEEKVVIRCPQCSGQLRVLRNKKGNITCPKCQNIIFVET